MELRNHQVCVTWDVGGGPGFVRNPVILKSDDIAGNRGDWFRIEVKRYTLF